MNVVELDIDSKSTRAMCFNRLNKEVKIVLAQMNKEDILSLYFVSDFAMEARMYVYNPTVKYDDFGLIELEHKFELMVLERTGKRSKNLGTYIHKFSFDNFEDVMPNKLCTDQHSLLFLYNGKFYYCDEGNISDLYHYVEELNVGIM